jgi:hypothetical protein
MIESKKSLNSIRLSSASYQSLGEMLKGVLEKDSEVKLNLSKLLSYLVLDYHERTFEKSIDKIILVHRDKRKDAAQKLGKMNEAQLNSVMKVLEKLEKETATEIKVDEK